MGSWSSPQLICIYGATIKTESSSFSIIGKEIKAMRVDSAKLNVKLCTQMSQKPSIKPALTYSRTNERISDIINLTDTPIVIPNFFRLIFIPLFVG